MKRDLRAELIAAKAVIEKPTPEVERWQGLCSKEREAREAAQESEKTARKQFNDLKERLSNAEMENQRMRGYIARVQEDDAVREELVTTGDPDGERQLVPKRKPTQFFVPGNSSDLSDRDMTSSGYRMYDRPKPKHWITY